MASAIVLKIAQSVTAPLIGGVIALGLRGEWNGFLLIAFVTALAIGSFAAVVRADDVLLHSLLALGFYSVAFQGLLGPLDGAFGGVWLLVTIGYSLVQAGVVFLSQVFAKNIALRAILWPFAAVAFEFIRHHTTKLYDGSGLTFCLLGQATGGNSYLLQSADLGGVWLLSFYCALFGGVIAVGCIQTLSKRFRVCFGSAAFVVLLGCVGYAHFCFQAQGSAVGDNTQHVYVCNRRPSVGQLQAIVHSIDELHRYTSGEVIVVFPETCVTWQLENAGSVPSVVET